MFERRPLLGLLIGLTVCVSIWRISIQEPSMIATEVGFSNQYQSQAQHQYQQQQHQQHHQQQPHHSVSFSSPASSNVYLVGRQAVSGSHHSRQLNGPNENIKTRTNSINYNNYFTNSYLRNSNYNLSLVSYPYSAVSYEALPKDDISKLIDLQNFEFIMNQKSCRAASSSSSSFLPSSPGNIKDLSSSSLNFNTETDNYYTKQNTEPGGGSPFLLIFVHSAPGNYKKRLLIRETWGSATNNIRLIFLLGSVNKTKDQHRLENENRMYSDMVQGNFIDDYRNMTYKHVMALKWFTYYCPNAKYILKIDDDVFVNTPNLVDYLNYVAERQNLLFCQKLYWSRVKRNYRSKWRVSAKEYSGFYYPTYCPGYSIVYSPDVAFRLYLEAQKTRYFWIDDVHVTGTLAQQANITIKSFEPFVLKQDDCEDILAGKTDINAIQFLFTWPDINEEQTRKLWKLVENLR